MVPPILSISSNNAAGFTLCYGLLFCTCFSQAYLASAQSVTQNIGGSLQDLLAIAKEGLIDELSVIVAPVADGAPDTPTLFERRPGDDFSGSISLH